MEGLVSYQPGQVVNRTLAQNPFLSLTVFAFAQGESLSAYSMLADALVQLRAGEVEVTIGDKIVTVRAGEVVVMAEDVPHALSARRPFKMLLYVIKRPQGPQV